MKKITLLLSLFAATNIFSQENITFLTKKIEKLFANVPIENLPRTLPFREGKKVGFLDAKTLKIMVEPVDYIDVRSTFCPDLFSAIIYDEKGNYFFSISKKKEITLTSVESFMNDIINDITEDTEDNNTESKGSEINSNRNRNASSLLHNQKQYTIVEKDSKKGIIDEKGKTLPHFNFIFYNITPNKYAKNGEPWFYVQEKRNDEGYFLSFLGKKILLKGLQWIEWDKIVFGYTIVWDNITEKCGILDLSTMKWVIPMQEKHHFGQILYTSNEELNKENVEDRQKAVMYIESWSKERVFLIDFNLNEYFPKK